MRFFPAYAICLICLFIIVAICNTSAAATSAPKHCTPQEELVTVQTNIVSVTNAMAATDDPVGYARLKGTYDRLEIKASALKSQIKIK